MSPLDGTDAAWQQLAVSTREALALLGYTITPQCLPGEPQACGASFAQHAWAHLHGLRAVTDHHLAHMSGMPEELAQEVYDGIMTDIQGNCQGVHR